MLYAGDVIAVYTYRFGKLTLFHFQFFRCFSIRRPNSSLSAGSLSR